jgi:hypothetical protein
MRRAIPRKDRFAPVSLSDCGWITGKQEVMYLSAAGSGNFEIKCWRKQTILAFIEGRDTSSGVNV